MSSSQEITEESPQISFTEPLNHQAIYNFKQTKAFLYSIFLMVFYIFFLTFLFPVQLMCRTEYCMDLCFSLAVNLNILLFFITNLLVYVLHRDLLKQKRRGYLKFYQNNSYLLKEIFILFAFGLAFLLCYSWLMKDIMYVKKQTVVSLETKYINFIGFQVILGIEIVACCIIAFILTVHIFKFNEIKPRPDAYEEDSIQEQLTLPSGANDLNYQDSLIETQQDKLIFYKQRCGQLYKALGTLLSRLPPEVPQISELIRQVTDGEVELPVSEDVPLINA